jgi:hypothetical protein
MPKHLPLKFISKLKEVKFQSIIIEYNFLLKLEKILLNKENIYSKLILKYVEI